MSYINAKGGSKSLECNNIASEIWHWCLDGGNIISAEHIPGILNQEADFESRNQNHNTEWSLDRTVTNRIFKAVNLIPSVDLFATRINTKVEEFVFWKPDPLASCVDTFAHQFNDELFYAFPPFSLLTKFLRKVEMEQMFGIIIAPAWSIQTFFPFLMDLLVQDHIILRWRDNLLHNPGIQEPHPLGKRLRLIACLVSSIPTKREEFLMNLRASCSRVGDPPLPDNIKFTLKDGHLFVNNMVKVPLQHV